MLSRLVIAFLPRSKSLLISWLQSPSAVTLETRNIKSVTVSLVSPSIWHEVMGLDAMILIFWMLSFKPAFSLCSFNFIKRFFSFSAFCHKGGVICISFHWKTMFYVRTVTAYPLCVEKSKESHTRTHFSCPFKPHRKINPWHFKLKDIFFHIDMNFQRFLLGSLRLPQILTAGSRCLPMQ